MDERERLTQWARDHGPAVLGFLRRRAGADAEDLLQETFRKAWEGRGRYAATGRDRAYLLTIADRLACDRARRRGRAPAVAVAEEIADRRPSPGQRLEDAEQHAALRQALERLPEGQRRALLLRYFGNLGFKEIAAALGCPLGTALSHCHRGLEALRRELAERPA